MKLALQIVTVVAAATAFATTAHAGPMIKPKSGAVKSLNPQPLPPVENPTRSSTVSPTSPNVRALSPQPLPPGGSVKAPLTR